MVLVSVNVKRNRKRKGKEKGKECPPRNTSKKSCTEQDKGVPEPRHGVSNKATILGNGASDFFAANASLMRSTEKSNEERVELFRKKEECAEKVFLMQQDLDAKKQSMMEMELKVNKALAMFDNPNLPEHLKLKAQNVIDHFLDF